MEIHNTVKEAVIQEAKWLSEEAIQIAEERRKMKGKGERERYIQLNAEFQRIARRDKKDFFSEQCKKKKNRGKQIEWERLEVPSRKLDISREHFMQGWA